jgi:thymidylate kinase
MDGSGKSVVIKPSSKIRPPHLGQIYQRRPDMPLTNGPKDARRNPAAAFPLRSVLKLCAMVFYFQRSHLTTLRRLRGQGWLVIFDRYLPQDILADPLRYRYGGPTWLLPLAKNLFPSPGISILLDAPAEVIQSRKQEVSFQENLRQRQAYLGLHAHIPGLHIIDASRPLLSVADEVIAILEAALP